jgi:hypothetical protein
MAQEMIVYRKYDDAEFPWAYAWGQDCQGMFEVDVHLMTQEEMVREIQGASRVEFVGDECRLHFEHKDIEMEDLVVEADVWERFVNY